MKEESSKKTWRRREDRGSSVQATIGGADDDFGKEPEAEDEDAEQYLSNLETAEAQFTPHFSVSWDTGQGCMRACDMHYLHDIPNKMHYGIPCSLAGDGQEISPVPEVGGKLLRRLWASMEPELEESEYMGTTPIDVTEEARSPKTGGFVFRTEPQALPPVLDECYQKHLVGCGSNMAAQVGFVESGTPIFLIDGRRNCLVFGVLICISDVDTHDPHAFTFSAGMRPLHPSSMQSPAVLPPSPQPHQVRFSVALQTQPLSCEDRELLTALGRISSEGDVTIPLNEGALTCAETARIIEVLARRQHLSDRAAVEEAMRAKLENQRLIQFQIARQQYEEHQRVQLAQRQQIVMQQTSAVGVQGLGAWWLSDRPGKFFQVVVLNFDAVMSSLGDGMRRNKTNRRESHRSDGNDDHVPPFDLLRELAGISKKQDDGDVGSDDSKPTGSGTVEACKLAVIAKGAGVRRRQRRMHISYCRLFKIANRWMDTASFMRTFEKPTR
jgi:hypothetical protein